MTPKSPLRSVFICLLTLSLTVSCKKKATEPDIPATSSQTIVNQKPSLLRDSSIFYDPNQGYTRTTTYRYTYNADNSIKLYNCCYRDYAMAFTGCRDVSCIYLPGTIVRIDSNSGFDTLIINAEGQLHQTYFNEIFDYYPATSKVWHRYQGDDTLTYTWSGDNIISYTDISGPIRTESRCEYYTDKSIRTGDGFQIVDFMYYGQTYRTNKNLIKRVTTTGFNLPFTTEFKYTFDGLGRVTQVTSVSADTKNPQTYKHFYSIEY